MLWTRWAIFFFAFIALLAVASIVMKGRDEWPRWVQGIVIVVFALLYATLRVGAKHYARKIRRYPPDFVPPLPPYDVPKPMPPEKKDLTA